MEPISGGYCCSSELRNNCDTKAVEFGTLDNSAFWQGGPFPECERERTVSQKSNTDRKWATFALSPGGALSPVFHQKESNICRNLCWNLEFRHSGADRCRPARTRTDSFDSDRAKPPRPETGHMAHDTLTPISKKDRAQPKKINRASWKNIVVWSHTFFEGGAMCHVSAWSRWQGVHDT